MGGLGITLPSTSTFWLPQAFLGESPAPSQPSWGSPQLPQAFLGESPASPGPSWEPTVMEATDNLIPGSHTKCGKLTPHNLAHLWNPRS